MPSNARALLEALKPDRDNYLRRARKASAYTIPTLIPPSGHNSSQELSDPYQGVGARAVDNLASKLLLALLPPHTPFFRLLPDEIAKQILAQDPKLEPKVERTLAVYENAAHEESEKKGHRVPAISILRHMIVGGNALQILEDGILSFAPLTSFVCKRDPNGDVVDVVLEEWFLPETAPEDVLNAWLSLKVETPSDSEEKKIQLLTVQRRDGDKYTVWQEVGGVMVGKTRTFREDNLPLRPLGFILEPGENYGRGLVEQHIGDLQSLEMLTKALVDGSLAMARLIGLVDPAASTVAEAINNAENGEFVQGRADDVSFLQVEKFGDFRVSLEMMQRIERRIEAAFLLNSSVSRDAERVTAEEIRFVAQELESSLGGIYTNLSQTFQLPLARALMSDLLDSGVLPDFPRELKDHIKPVIVAGVNALGRTQDLERIRAAFGVLAAIVGPEQVAQVTNLGPIIEAVFTAAGVKTEGLTKTEEQMAQERQAAQQMAMVQAAVEKGVAPAVAAAGENINAQ